MFRDNSIVIGYGGDFCGDYGKEGGLFYKWLFLGVFYFFVIVIFIIGKLVFFFLVIINVWCNIMIKEKSVGLFIVDMMVIEK